MFRYIWSILFRIQEGISDPYKTNYGFLTLKNNFAKLTISLTYAVTVILKYFIKLTSGSK